MSIVTRSQSRKRNRPDRFVLNRTIMEEKRRKDHTILEMPVEDMEIPQITDLSQTITTPQNAIGAAFSQGPAGSSNIMSSKSPSNTAMSSDVLRQQKHLECTVQNVQSEMREMTNMIRELKDLATHPISSRQPVYLMERGLSNDNNVPSSRSGTSQSSSETRSGQNNVSSNGNVFDGTSRGLSVEDFVYRLEHYQRQYTQNLLNTCLT